MNQPSYITQDNFPHFKRAYQQAVELNQAVFVFEGHTVLTKYAKYVVEYADSLQQKK